MLNPHLFQTRIARGDVEATCERDEMQVVEGIVGARVSGEAGDSFQNKAVAVKELGNDGSQRGKDTSGVGFSFSGAVVGERLAGKAHQKEVNVGKGVIERELRGITADEHMVRYGEGGDVMVDFNVGVREEANKFGRVEHASSASTQLDGEVVSFLSRDTSNRGGDDVDQPGVVLASFQGGCVQMDGVTNTDLALLL